MEPSQLIDKSGYFAGYQSTRDQLRYSPDQGFYDSNNSSLAESTTDSFVNSWRFSGEAGEASIHTTKIRPGFQVNVTKTFFKKDMFCTMLEFPSSIAFSFCISGHSIARLSVSNEDKELWEGHHGISYTPAFSCIWQIKAGIPLLLVSIRLETEELWHFFNDEKKLLPPVFRHILDCMPHKEYQKRGAITPEMLMAAQQIIDCRQQGYARKLFLESRALELISYQMDYFAKADPSGHRPKAMHPEDRRKTEHAHDLLVSDIEQPPNLRDLARAVGMSHTKLCCCFKQVFGSTAFECLRNERLRRAREMLEQQGVTATEAAYAVGYSSPSHFSQAYKKHFGRLPIINPE